jgi:hypothetical protein
MWVWIFAWYANEMMYSQRIFGNKHREQYLGLRKFNMLCIRKAVCSNPKTGYAYWLLHGSIHLFQPVLGMVIYIWAHLTFRPIYKYTPIQ